MFSFECVSHKKNVLVFFIGQFHKDFRSGLSTDIQNSYDKNLTPDVVILLYPSYLQEDIISLKDDSGFVTDLSRHKHSNVEFYKFTSEGRVELGMVLGGMGSVFSNFDPDLFYKDIIRGGYANLVGSRVNDVLVPAPSGTVFVKLSGNPLDEFIYASQLARCNYEHQFIAFSLLHYSPDLNSIDCIFIDTSSISAIAEALTYYISRFNGDNCKRIRYKSFSSYSGMEKSKPDNPDGAWVIISASASTNMGKSIVKDWIVNPKNVITILSYENPLVESDKNEGNGVVFSVNDYSKRNEDVLSPVKVQVQGESFSAEVALPGRVFIKKLYRPDYVIDSIYKYHNKDVFKSNIADRKVYFDYSAFRKIDFDNTCINSKNDKYSDWLMQAIKWTVPRNLKGIIYDPTNSGELFVQDIITAISACNYDIMDINIYKSDDDNDLSNIGDGALIIASTTISSGRVFVDINRELRLAKHDGMRIFITPFVTAPSKKEHEDFKISLCFGTRGFKYVFNSYKTIYVGDKSFSTWKKELGLLKKLIEDDSDKYTYWIERKKQLEMQGVGLCGKLGLAYQSCGSARLSFAPDFVFWPPGYNSENVNAESIFATIASILQNLREKNFDGVTLRSNVYKHSVLDPENFVRFNDPILQSCLWRAASPQELDYRRSDELSTDIQRIFSKIFKSANTARGEVALDLLMAIALKWIKLSSDPLKQLMTDANEYLVEPHAKVLIDYINNSTKKL